MVRLEQLKPNFVLMNHEEQLAFFNKYREKRHKDLIETTVVKIDTKGKKRTTERKVTVSPKAFELLQKLGLV